MSTKDFIEQLIAGENSTAKQTLEDLISNKAFQALDEYKKQIATSAFTGDIGDLE